MFDPHNNPGRQVRYVALLFHRHEIKAVGLSQVSRHRSTATEWKEH